MFAQTSSVMRGENAVACLGTVVARSESDEPIQTITAERFWIASLSLATTVVAGAVRVLQKVKARHTFTRRKKDPTRRGEAGQGLLVRGAAAAVRTIS
ncbi:MAG: hypothetical protein ACRECL_05565 [Bradyrhizobium sp.]